MIVEQAGRGQGRRPRITAMTPTASSAGSAPATSASHRRPIAKLDAARTGVALAEGAQGHRRAARRESKRSDRRARPSARTRRKLVERYEAHPVHDCPDVDEHLKLATEIAELDAEIARLRRLMRRRRDTIARVVRPRARRARRDCGYVDGWTLTDKGRAPHARLQRGGSPRRRVPVAAAGSTVSIPTSSPPSRRLFVYESRRRDEPRGAADAEARALRAPHREPLPAPARRRSASTRSSFLKEPDAGFMAQIHEWARGSSLEDILEDRETSAGDFVRSTKQVIDLLQQLRRSSSTGDLADTLREAVDRVQRGVVAYSSVV